MVDKLQYLVPCPVCGTSHGMKVTEHVRGKKYIPLTRRPYYEVMAEQFDREKPLGIILRHRGRSKEPGEGGNEFVGTFEPGEDPDNLFVGIKRQMLQAVACWLDKGWITDEEIVLTRNSRGNK